LRTYIQTESTISFKDFFILEEIPEEQGGERECFKGVGVRALDGFR